MIEKKIQTRFTEQTAMDFGMDILRNKTLLSLIEQQTNPLIENGLIQALTEFFYEEEMNSWLN